MMAALFARSVRSGLLAAARSQRLRRTVQRLPVTRRMVHRFVPGENCAEVLTSGAALRESGRLISIDQLGEDVRDVAGATATVTGYLELLDALGRRHDVAYNGVRPLEVSVKLSALGQALGRDGEKIALANAYVICERAAQAGVWVTVDAEDHTTTDSTLSIASQLRGDFDWLGVALQAYLRRTLGDCADLCGTRVRLCKGAYDEPATVAYRDRNAVTDNYLRCLRLLMAGSGYPMVASHDPVVIAAAADQAARLGRAAGGFEYQMLYGIRDAEQRRLAATGFPVRVYLPFGVQWYGYFMRRLAERPANLAFFLRALAEGPAWVTPACRVATPTTCPATASSR